MTAHGRLSTALAGVLVVLALAGCGDESGTRTRDGFTEVCKANENFVSGEGCVPAPKAEKAERKHGSRAVESK